MTRLRLINCSVWEEQDWPQDRSLSYSVQLLGSYGTGHSWIEERDSTIESSIERHLFTKRPGLLTKREGSGNECAVDSSVLRLLNHVLYENRPRLVTVYDDAVYYSYIRRTVLLYTLFLKAHAYIRTGTVLTIIWHNLALALCLIGEWAPSQSKNQWGRNGHSVWTWFTFQCIVVLVNPLQSYYMGSCLLAFCSVHKKEYLTYVSSKKVWYSYNVKNQT